MTISTITASRTKRQPKWPATPDVKVPIATPIWVFLCNSETRQECLARHLFGTSPLEWRREFGPLEQGDRALLYDYHSFEFIGLYEIVEHANGRSLESRAWHGDFPAQVHVRPLGKTHAVCLQSIDVPLANRLFPAWRGEFPIACVEDSDAECLAALFSDRSSSATGSTTAYRDEQTYLLGPASKQLIPTSEGLKPRSRVLTECPLAETNPQSNPEPEAARADTRLRKLWAFLLRLIGIGTR